MQKLSYYSPKKLIHRSDAVSGGDPISGGGAVSGGPLNVDQKLIELLSPTRNPKRHKDEDDDDEYNKRKFVDPEESKDNPAWIQRPKIYPLGNVADQDDSFLTTVGMIGQVEEYVDDFEKFDTAMQDLSPNASIHFDTPGSVNDKALRNRETLTDWQELKSKKVLPALLLDDGDVAWGITIHAKILIELEDMGRDDEVVGEGFYDPNGKVYYERGQYLEDIRVHASRLRKMANAQQEAKERSPDVQHYDNTQEVLDVFKKKDIDYDLVSIPLKDMKVLQTEISQSKVDALVKKLKDGDVLPPMILSESNDIVDGNHRYYAFEEQYGEDYNADVLKVEASLGEIRAVLELTNTLHQAVKKISLPEKLSAFPKVDLESYIEYRATELHDYFYIKDIDGNSDMIVAALLSNSNYVPEQSNVVDMVKLVHSYGWDPNEVSVLLSTACKDCLLAIRMELTGEPYEELGTSCTYCSIITPRKNISMELL